MKTAKSYYLTVALLTLAVVLSGGRTVPCRWYQFRGI